MTKRYGGLVPACTLAAGAAVSNGSETQVEPAAFDQLVEIVVIGTRQDADAVPGSGTVVDANDLEVFDYVDLNQVLAQVPGVYVREEDGYGLRPNIGIRGASAERSQKITIMEDGVLITPAPYSAPAAYYVPNVSRIHALEVLKGPSAIRHGPHTVGGAMNFVTRPVPEASLAEVDLSLGNHGFHKVQGAFGRRASETTAWYVEGLRYGSSGFKALDGGGDTGFVRNAADAKLSWVSDGALDQQLTIKFGFADEDADETYLGLTDRDFDDDPVRRYRASQLANFTSTHTLLHLNYGIAVNDRLRLNAKAYWNRFDREWNKVDGFLSGTSIQAVLERPGSHPRQLALLRGESDSTGIGSDIIDITNNDRAFDVQGVQINASLDATTGVFDHAIVAGVRAHQDEVDRDHRQRGYLMAGGDLVWDGVARGSKTINHADSQAVSVFVTDEITTGNWTATVGVRFEEISGTFNDYLYGANRTSSQSVTSPGLGIRWQPIEGLNLLAGVYHANSPAGPGSQDVDPEQSVNLEYGARYSTSSLRLEAVGFFSDYDNLLGRCRVSDSGCEAGDEFNGGRVEIAGVELGGAVQFAFGDAAQLELDLAYTYTESSFQTGFLSQFSQWGLVRVGDELPYLPAHVGRAGLRLLHGRWDASAVVRGQTQMRERPGSEAIEDDLHTDGFLVLDLSLRRTFLDAWLAQLTLSNATDEAAIVSHRPFGARPNRPRSIVARVKYSF